MRVSKVNARGRQLDLVILKKAPKIDGSSDTTAPLSDSDKARPKTKGSKRKPVKKRPSSKHKKHGRGR